MALCALYFTGSGCAVRVWIEQCPAIKVMLNSDLGVETYLDAFAILRKVIISVVMSVRPPAWNNSASTGRISKKLDIWAFSKKVAGSIPDGVTNFSVT